MGFFDHDEVRELRDIAHELRMLRKFLTRATSGSITQLGGNMAITGVQVGASGTFQVTWNGAMQAGSGVSWSASDALVSFSAAPDSDPNKTVASLPGSDTGTSFDLTATGTASDGTTVSAKTTVPILPATPPPPAPATGGTIDQIA